MSTHGAGDQRGYRYDLGDQWLRAPGAVSFRRATPRPYRRRSHVGRAIVRLACACGVLAVALALRTTRPVSPIPISQAVPSLSPPGTIANRPPRAPAAARPSPATPAPPARLVPSSSAPPLPPAGAAPSTPLTSTATGANPAAALVLPGLAAAPQVAAESPVNGPETPGTVTAGPAAALPAAASPAAASPAAASPAAAGAGAAPTSTEPLVYGCPAALAYLANHQAPGFVDVCAPGAAGPGAAGRTVAWVGASSTTGTIYLSCPSPIVYQNEASNSWKFSGLSTSPLDPWGGVPIRECQPGDIAPR